MSDAQRYIAKRFKQEKADKDNAASHLIIDMQTDPPSFYCKNCGEREELRALMPHDQLSIIRQGFVIKHALCEKMTSSSLI